MLNWKSNVKSNFLENSRYYYSAYCTRVYDGDTAYFDVKLGLYIIAENQRIRLYKIQAPKLSTKEGKLSRDYLANRVEKKQSYIRTFPDKKSRDRYGKYGRWLGIIYTVHGQNINYELLNKGFVDEYKLD